MSERQKNMPKDRLTDRQTDRQTDRKTERQKDRKTERQKDRKTERLLSLVIKTNVVQNLHRMSKSQSDRQEDI